LLVKFGATPIESKNQKNNKKMAPPTKQKVNEKKVPKPFMLTMLKDGCYQPLSYEEF